MYTNWLSSENIKTFIIMKMLTIYLSKNYDIAILGVWKNIEGEFRNNLFYLT